MTKTQDRVPKTHNGITKLPCFHFKKSRDTACYALKPHTVTISICCQFRAMRLRATLRTLPSAET